MNVKLGLVILPLSVGLPVWGQWGKTPSHPPSVRAAPEEIVRQLTSSDSDVRKQWVLKLGLDDLISDDGLKLEDKPAAFLRNVGSRLLVVKGADIGWTMYLVPMIRPDGDWQTLPAVPLSTHYEAPTITLDSLVRKGEQEIVVSHLWVDHGTGVQQTNLTIYKLIDGAMRIIFDQPEHLHFFTVLNPPDTYDEYQESTFKFVEKEPNAAGLKAIEETRVETVGKRRITVHRTYCWKPEIQAYRMEGAGPE
jgi:hypothetical protein